MSILFGESEQRLYNTVCDKEFMTHIDINKPLGILREILEKSSEKHAISLKLLEILEMLIDRREEDSLLVKDRLEEILSSLD